MAEVCTILMMKGEREIERERERERGKERDVLVFESIKFKKQTFHYLYVRC